MSRKQIASQMIIANASLVVAAYVAGSAIHNWLIESPPIEIAILGGISVLMFGFSLISTIWIGILNLSETLATRR